MTATTMTAVGEPRRKATILQILLGCFILLLTPLRTFGQVCTAAPPVTQPIQIAILVHCKAPRGVLDGNPNFSTMCATDYTVTGGVITRAFNFGLDMYVEEFKRQLMPRGMPLSDGNFAVFNFTYVNIGEVDWSAPDWDALTASLGNRTQGFAYDLFMTSTYGGPYPFAVAPYATNVVPLAVLADVCEEYGTCIISSGFTASAPMFACRESLTDGSLPEDCVRRGRLSGTRRFDHFLSVLFDASAVSVSGLDTFHVIGVKTLYVLSDGALQSFFPMDAAATAVEFAKELNIKVVGQTELVQCDPTRIPGNCPQFQKDGQPAVGEVQILPSNQTTEEFAAQLMQLNPDALIILATTNGGSIYTIGSLFDGFRSVGWTPRIINFGGGGDSVLAPYLTKPEDLSYWFTNTPWDQRLTGPTYRNVLTPSNFELFPAEPSLDAPAVFVREFKRRYDQYFPAPAGSDGPGGYDFSEVGAIWPVFAFQSLIICQKLVETALSASVPALVTASLKVSVPSLYHQLQFDEYGRTVRVNEVLLQYIPVAGTDIISTDPSSSSSSSSSTTHSNSSSSTSSGVVFATHLISPYNIGVPPVYPAPTWSERVWSPERYALQLEQIMAGVNSGCIIVVVAFIVMLILQSNHMVIRAATPSFCILTCLGALLMLCSNFFHTTVETSTDCAAQVWLLTMGFTLLFSSLFIKTYRVFKIFSGRLLTPTALSNVDLLLFVGGSLMVDVILNAAWQGAVGLQSVRVVVDPIRPKYDELVCRYNSAGMVFVYLHLGWKCGLLVIGIVLTWLVRKTPSAFNEASFMGICIYNVSFVVCFVVPMLAKDVGGRETTYLIRAFAIMFVCISTICILYVPKQLTILESRRTSHKSAAVAGNAARPGTLNKDGVGGKKFTARELAAMHPAGTGGLQPGAGEAGASLKTKSSFNKYGGSSAGQYHLVRRHTHAAPVLEAPLAGNVHIELGQYELIQRGYMLEGIELTQDSGAHPPAPIVMLADTAPRSQEHTSGDQTESPVGSASPHHLDATDASELAHTELDRTTAAETYPPHLDPTASPPGRIDSELHLTVLPTPRGGATHPANRIIKTMRVVTTFEDGSVDLEDVILPSPELTARDAPRLSGSERGRPLL